MAETQEQRFQHRDLDWLNFNERVLQEAADKNVPVLERLKFLAIFSSNLDEYYRVRVSQLRQIKKIKKSLRKKLALRPNKKVKQIIKEVKIQQAKFGEIFKNEILIELAENHIHLIQHEDFSKDQIAQAKEIYNSQIKEHLKPQLVDFNKKNQLFLENNTVYLFVAFENCEEAGVVNLPVEEVGRFIELKNKGKEHFISFLDDIVRTEIHEVYPKRKVEGIYQVKMSRDAELYIDDQFNGVLAEKIYESLEQRTDGQPTRLLYDAEMPKELQKKLRKHLGLGKIDMMPGGKYHNFSDFFSFPDPTHNSTLKYKDLTPIPHKYFEAEKDYFKLIREKDQLLHFPYMSFSYVENFVEQAAEDDDVVSIKISLYRVADESALTSSLLKALEKGKEVTVFIEAKARFDEENNITWGRKFEEKGANVIYSYPKIKVHSKIFLIDRIEKGESVKYAYIGTGNFNAETSKIYCDHALFTAHKKITKELDRVFKVLEGELIIPRAKNLLVSPFDTRREFTQMILHEIDEAEAGRKAKITAKMNSLEDEEMIDLLYRANKSGVNIRLLVRGFTSLIAGVKNLSEHIYITSIIDRFLEHGRIYVFHNGGDERVFIGSADWMNRNLNRRIEVLAPIFDEDIKQELKEILQIQLNDNVKARVQDYTQKNEYVKHDKKKPIRSQYEIYKYLQKKHS
ncbi:polyphosphate kinase 1 [Mesonia sp.]|uniref:polyphosphate kinase 1 n=1 Tax=Mesonia sp. TaxID=1960830 RepID=UPI00177000E5|nr:polyphosphate kinase 1 [Mesonia sp.]HIB38387.1 polyphosphate kinase 1 [Mesonia sp.]HIO27368.1 polyphosphate kinase 1 [Flavobacteriaceae bacterium]